MVTIKSGSWANVNDKRMFVTHIDDKRLVGIKYDGKKNDIGRTVEIPLQKIRTASRSRRPSDIPSKVLSKIPTSFGQLDWDERKQKITAVRFIKDKTMQIVS